MSNAIIKVIDTLNNQEGARIVDQLLEANRDPKVENIVLVICSAGGNVSIITPIWEIVKMCDKPVCAIGMSLVASAAASIFMMAKKRILLPNTEFMVHKALTGLSYPAPEYELEKAFKRTQSATKVAWAPLIRRSGLNEDILNKKCKNQDWWLTEQEIRKYSIITDEYDREEVKKLLMN